MLRVPKKPVSLFLLAVLATVLAWLALNSFPRFGQGATVAAVYRDIALAEARELNLRIETGDFFAAVLERAGVETQEAVRLVSDIRPAYDLARIRSGQILTMFFEAGKLRNLIYPIDRETYLEAERDGPDRFRGRVMAIPYEVRREVIRIGIENSLYESTTANGEKPELCEPLARIFEYDVDFNRDIQPGDLLSAVLEKKYLNGRLTAYGDILAAELVNNGKVIRIVRYPSPSGSMGYYHPDGSSTRRQFLRCPLPFIRVTSRFGMRMHPVLGFSARHNGTDFAAPTGTTVRATASGTVTGRGRDKNRGNFVTIRHANGFASHYYHLQGFAAGLNSGRRVEQGQVIGYVGNTGLSTGPHLHYGLLRNGRFLNPLKLQSPTVAPLPEQTMDGFRKYCARICLPLSQAQKPMPGNAIAAKLQTMPSLHASSSEKMDCGGSGGDE